MATVAVQSDVAVENTFSKPTIAAKDARRVWLAVGITLALLIVDIALYLPRLL